jgi:hypothetical protein
MAAVVTMVRTTTATDEAAARLREIARARKRVVAAQQRVVEATDAWIGAVRSARDEGVTVSDAARVSGVSSPYLFAKLRGDVDDE